MSFLGLNSPSNQSQIDSEEQKTKNAVGAIIFFILLGVGLIVGGSVFYNMHSANRTHEWLGNNGTKVSAQCVAKTYDGRKYCADYEFAVGERKYRGSSKTRYLSLSDKEDVFYDPANPSINRLAIDKPPYDLNPMYFGLIATFVLGLLAKFFVEPIVSKIFVKKP